MYRHENLRPLSRDHHRALQLARSLQRSASPGLRATLPPDLDDVVAEVRRRFAEELDIHFRLEEQGLAPAIETRDPVLAQMAAELRDQHHTLRNRVAELPDAVDTEEALDRLGRLLEQHVRWEERVLFEEIQQRLDARSIHTLPIGSS